MSKDKQDRFPDGRYEDDLMTTLEHNPVEKYAWRVKGYAWEPRRWRGAAWPWGVPYGDRSFKTAKAALDYRAQIQKSADLEYIDRLQAKQIEAQWEAVL